MTDTTNPAAPERVEVLCSRLLGHAADLRSENWDEDHAAAADVEEAAHRLAALANPSGEDPLVREVERLREVLHGAKLQLDYLDGRFPTGTTPTTIARIDAALAQSITSGKGGE